MANRFFNQLLSVSLMAFMASGCVSTRTEKRSQTIKVNTNPPGAQVWVGDKTGQNVVGSSPVTINGEYEVGIYKFNNWWWLLLRDLPH